MDRPTAADVREWALSGDLAKPRVNFTALGYPVPSTGDDPLDQVVAFAIAYIQRITGRKLDETLTDPDLETIAKEVVLMVTVQRIVSTSGSVMLKRADTLLDGIKSFRAGDYNQVNRDLDETRKAGLINPWAELSELLLLLATPERLEEITLQLTGQAAPAMFAMAPSLDPFTYNWG
jgi:hypothetical protein